MIKTTTVSIAICLLAALPAFAAESGTEPRTQQNKMSQCSASAKEKGLSGADRKQFMSECLRSTTTSSAQRACTDEAKGKGLKGEKRKSFVTDCVKARETQPMG